jgi:hypothetical protein
LQIFCYEKKQIKGQKILGCRNISSSGIRAIFPLEREKQSHLMGVAETEGREKLNESLKARAWTAALAFQAISLMELIVRFDDFDHGAVGEKAWALDWRVSFGGKYNIRLHERLDMPLDIAAEYRYSEFQKEENEKTNDRTNEYFFNLEFSFISRRPVGH